MLTANLSESISSIVEDAPNAGYALKMLGELGIISTVDEANRYAVPGFVFWQCDINGFQFEKVPTWQSDLIPSAPSLFVKSQSASLRKTSES